MNSFTPGTEIPATESFLDERYMADKYPTRAHNGRVLVAGYSFHSGACTLKATAENSVPPKAAILYADSDDALLERRESEGETRLGVLKGRQRFRGLVVGFGGKFACYTGNFIIAEFDDVDTALQCAVNAQIALRNQNACLQSKFRTRYRLGIEVCKPASLQETQFNRSVDLVAELERREHPGGIYVSQLAREYLQQRSIAQFVSLGMRYPHNAREPIEAFWIEMDRSMLFDIS